MRDSAREISGVSTRSMMTIAESSTIRARRPQNIFLLNSTSDGQIGNDFSSVMHSTQPALFINDNSHESSTGSGLQLSFSQLFRHVLQPLQLEIGRNSAIDWLTYLLVRFQAHLSLIPQRTPDLLFAIHVCLFFICIPIYVLCLYIK